MEVKIVAKRNSPEVYIKNTDLQEVYALVCMSFINFNLAALFGLGFTEGGKPFGSNLRKNIKISKCNVVKNSHCGFLNP